VIKDKSSMIISSRTKHSVSTKNRQRLLQDVQMQSPHHAPGSQVAAFQPVQSAALEELDRLRRELEREKVQRSQAERDFEELLGTVEEMAGGDRS
jgi:chromosome segregation ATPase